MLIATRNLVSSEAARLQVCIYFKGEAESMTYAKAAEKKDLPLKTCDQI